MEYHKIVTVWKRDPETKFRTLIEGEYALPEFDYLKDNQWRFTEKVDGTNIRVIWNGEGAEFRGKTDRAQTPPFLLARLAEILPAEILQEVFGSEPAILYGEGYGAKIQKGGGNYIPDGCDFILFDVASGGLWLEWGNVCDIAEKLAVRRVPEVGMGTLPEMIEIARRGLTSAIAAIDRPAEGLVARPLVELQSRRGHRIITKVKTRDFPDA